MHMLYPTLCLSMQQQKKAGGGGGRGHIKYITILNSTSTSLARQRGNSYMYQDSMCTCVYYAEYVKHLTLYIFPFYSVFCSFPFSVSGFRNSVILCNYWLHTRVTSEIVAKPRLTLVFEGWQFPMLPSRAVNIYYIILNVN